MATMITIPQEKTYEFRKYGLTVHTTDTNGNVTTESLLPSQTTKLQCTVADYITYQEIELTTAIAATKEFRKIINTRKSNVAALIGSLAACGSIKPVYSYSSNGHHDYRPDVETILNNLGIEYTYSNKYPEFKFSTVLSISPSAKKDLLNIILCGVK